MAKKRILILGAGIMQGPALKIAEEMGLETIAADADPKAPCINLANRFEKVDLKDRDGIERLAQNLKKEASLDGIMTAGTDFSANVAWAAEKTGLPGIPYESALDASDKERMRKRFREEGIPSPEFIIMEKAEYRELPFPWPVVVKPVDNMGSRGCRRVDSAEELEIAVKDALYFSRSGRVIIEEFMEGPEFSVDALVYNGEITICGFADRHIFFPPYFIEMGHTIPSAFNPNTVKDLLDTFKKGVKALGINNGAAKGDIKLTPKGPMIGEIAARLSGGYMSGWTFPYSSGVLVTRGALEIAIGEKPSSLEPKWNLICAERAFISIPGTVKSIHGSELAPCMPLVKNVFFRIKKGSIVSFPENNVTKCGNVLSVASGREEAINSAEKAARSILIRLEPNNEATDDFLEFRSGASGTSGQSPASVSTAASDHISGKSQSSGKSPASSSRAAIFPPNAFAFDPHLADSIPETDLTGLDLSKTSEIGIIPFPKFMESGLKDYVGRSINESLDAIRTLTGLELPLATVLASALAYASSHPQKPFLGRSFWLSIIRGGYQGGAYYIDSRVKK